MVKTGLVSITFRKLGVEELIEIVSKAGLDGIEWGGDVHVPHGDVEKAREVKKMSSDAGLEVAAYGSYYRLACENELSFEDVLETAVALGAPVIRVWAGNKGSAKADEAWWSAVVQESRKIASLAEEKGIKVAYEYHDNTLTDTDISAIRLLEEVNHPNMITYWQPPHKKSVEERIKSIKSISKYLNNIHVFYWTQNGKRLKHPLQDAKEDWVKYLQIAKNFNDEVYAMLEFVKGDKLEQFYEDAAVLKEIVSTVNS